MLQARNLVRRAGSRRLLDDVSLDVVASDRIAIVGATGSGKTVLLRALVMLDPIDQGEILWQGDPVTGHRVPELRSRSIYLHQRPAFSEGTVEEVMREPFRWHVHRGREYSRAWILEHLSRLGRGEDLLERQTGDLSGGELQITALLRAMQLAPEILLLDEPTSALDTRARDGVESLISDWLDESPARAIVWVTHEPDPTRRLANQVWSMRDGRLVREAPDG